MNKDNSIDHEVTEELTDLINQIDESEIETLDEKDDKTKRKAHDDFSDLVRKRDYKGYKPPVNKNKSHKRKLKKWVYVVLIILFVGTVFGGYKIVNRRNIIKDNEEKTKILDNIKSHYNQYVKVSNDTSLYEKDGSNYQEVGTVYKDANLELEEMNIDLNTKYFKIKNLDYYVAYSDVSEGDEQADSDRYKKYVPFNINIVTKKGFTMYDGNEKVITLNKEMEFPVIINNFENKYYVEYNNRLVSISKDDVSKTLEKKNTEKKNQSKMTTLAYHRVYDTDEKCTDAYICTKKSLFDKQMNYLAENNYLSLTMNELYMYLKGNLQVEKGVTITFDDGYLYKSADEVLDKYHLNGTMFVISGNFKEYDEFKNLKAIDIQSHTHNMHTNYVCSGGNQGGAILCASKEKIVEDLKKSITLLEVEPIALAFPFYDYNENAINALKEVGFKMSFIGRAGVMGKATPKVTNVYKIPRMTVWDESLMSFNTWKGYL